MKATIFYIITSGLIIFCLAQLFGWDVNKSPLFSQSEKELNSISTEDLQNTLIGKWKIQLSITDEEQELKLNGDVIHKKNGEFILYYKLSGRDPDFFNFGNCLTGGGSMTGTWYVSDSLASWHYIPSDCSFDVSYHRSPFRYFDLCKWLEQDVGLSFGSYTNGLGKQSFTHFSNSQIDIEEIRYSEKGERVFFFNRINK